MNKLMNGAIGVGALLLLISGRYAYAQSPDVLSRQIQERLRADPKFREYLNQGKITLPDEPPSGFWAICSVGGVDTCRVQGKTPIAPESTCSCGTQRGQTR
jgi:hypothetical protein